MIKHPYRTVAIWAILLIALFNIYPTVGWMTLEDDTEWLSLSVEEQEETMPKEGTRQYRLRVWEEQDDERAALRHGAVRQMLYDIRRWAEFDRDKVINLGLDLQGGIHMVLGFDINDLPAERLQQYRDDGYSDSNIEEELQETVLQQIRRRINEFEAREPVIQALGSNQIQIQLPGEKDIERAQRLITTTAVLNFHIVAGMDETAQTFTKIRQAFPDEFMPFVNRPVLGGDFTVDTENYARVRDVVQRAEAQGILPEDKIIFFSQPPKPFQDQSYTLYLVDKTPLQSGEGLRSASTIPNPDNPPFWMILFELRATEAANFRQATQNNTGSRMAIVLDNFVLSAPVISEAIGASGRITGSFESLEARDLAISLNSGSMAVPVREEYTGIVGASLGADSVRSGVISALTGIALVAVFMVIYYLSAGVLAVFSLLVNATLVIGAMAYFNMTLTLPGIAGLILTVGMAVDANVLIFERIREELRLGHSLLSSVENGFKRASITILDANVTTLIAAFILFQFGTGPIEGFAITLTIGVICSVFTALVVNKALFDFMMATGFVKEMKMCSFFKPETHIPFLHWRRIALAASAVVIAIGVGAFGMRGADMFGVEFTQGTNIMATLDNEERIQVGDVRDVLMQAGFVEPIVQEAGAGGDRDFNHFIIRVGETGQDNSVNGTVMDEDVAGVTDDESAVQSGEVDSALISATVSSRIENALAALTQSGSVSGVDFESVQTIGPAVGKQLRWDAVLSIWWSLVFIVIYLTLRFELKFAAGAVVALIHDVLITVGIFALLGRQISLHVVAAVLTIIGYSLNDSIVVFDRIREDMGLKRGKGIKFIDILNDAVNQTLGRTILTSSTTLFVVLMLFLFGGQAINDFALALLIGVVVGTYSSIFVASPVVYLWHTVALKRRLQSDALSEGAGNRYKKSTKGKKKANADNMDTEPSG